MSLINEALRRTRDASFQSPTPAAPVPPSYRACQDNYSRASRLGPIIAGATVAVGLIALAAFALALVLGRAQQSLPPVTHPASLADRPNTSPTPPEKAPTTASRAIPSLSVAKPDSSPAPPPPSSAAVTTVKPDTKAAEDQLVARLVERIKAETPPPAPAAAAPLAAAPVAPTPPPPPPPKLQLQGITSDGQSREAMINGYNVRVGDTIEGARVTAIEAGLVQLQFGSQELTLRLR